MNTTSHVPGIQISISKDQSSRLHDEVRARINPAQLIPESNGAVAKLLRDFAKLIPDSETAAQMAEIADGLAPSRPKLDEELSDPAEFATPIDGPIPKLDGKRPSTFEESQVTRSVVQDCPKCGGETDNPWECGTCGLKFGRD